MSVVYVLTNEAMPGLVKIGKTSGSIEKRMHETLQSKVYRYLLAVFMLFRLKMPILSSKIHEAFDDVRLNESREFFTIAPEKVKAALEITGGKDVT